MDASLSPSPDIHFKRICAENVIAVCDLSKTLPPQQRNMVSDNAVSIAQASCSEHIWMRAIYAGDTPVGFILLHIGSDYEDGIDCPGVFLWRFMIARSFQGKGYGKKIMERLFDHLRSLGIPKLFLSCGLGEESPEGFYKKFGFIRTGEWYGDEIEMVLNLA